MRLYLSSYLFGDKSDEFVSMISGNKHTALILDAHDFFSASHREASRIQEIDDLKELGITSEELDLRKFFGKRDELKKELERFDAVWIPGGNSFLLRYVMRKSGFDEIIKELLINDKIVYAGFSAGVVVLGETMRGIELADEVKYVRKIYNAEPVWEGLGILPYNILPHYKCPTNPVKAELIDKVIEFYKEKNIQYKTLSDGEAFAINNS
jgi:dipeptidase E